MSLTDKTVKNVKPGDTPTKLFDGGGMFLLVAPAGQRYWRLKYRTDGKEKLLALGVYPDVSLAAARKKRDAARERLAAGIDPGEAMMQAHRQVSTVAGRQKQEGCRISVSASYAWPTLNRRRYSPGVSPVTRTNTRRNAPASP